MSMTLTNTNIARNWIILSKTPKNEILHLFSFVFVKKYYFFIFGFEIDTEKIYHTCFQLYLLKITFPHFIF